MGLLERRSCAVQKSANFASTISASAAPTVPGGFRTLETDLASDQTQVMSTMPPPPAAPPAATVAAPTIVPPARTPGRPPSETQIMSVLDIPLPPRNSAVPPAASGATVLAVLHDLSLAAAWCDRVLVLERGAIVADGAPHAVLDEALVSRVWGIPVRRLEGASTRDIAFLAA